MENPIGTGTSLECTLTYYWTTYISYVTPAASEVVGIQGTDNLPGRFNKPKGDRIRYQQLGTFRSICPVEEAFG